MDELTYVEAMPQMFRQLAEESPAGLCLVSGDEFRIKWSNKAYRDFFSVADTGQDICGMRLVDLVPHFSASGMEQIFRDVASSRRPYSHAEQYFESPGRGATFWQWSLTALPAAPDQVPGLVIQALDVTSAVSARQAAIAQTQAMQQERRVYQTILSATPDFNYLLNLQGQFVYANEALINFLALADGVIGKTFYDIGYPQGLARRLDNALRQVIATKQPASLETAFAPSAGEYRIHECIFVPVLDEQGAVVSVAGATRNITERKSSEQQLRASEEKFKLLANTIPQLAWMANPDGWIYWYNDRWYEYTGTTLQDMEGWGWQQVHHPDLLPEVMAAWKASLATGEPFEMSFLLKGADGQFRFFLTKSVALKNEAGQVLNWFGTNTDISEQQRRADERAHTQLMQALSQRLAEAQEDERKQLSRELHDKVGQNLTALNINFDILLEQMSGDASVKLRERINDSIMLVEKTAACIENIMTELRPPMLDDYGLIAALRWYATLFQKRSGVTVRVIGPDAAPRLDLVQESALFRIAQEALNNVAKHAQARDVVISLWFKNEEVHLVISDDGIGFTKKLLKHPSKQSRRGVLTMQERALAAGGQISIESAPHKGTKVSVKLTRGVETK